MALFFQTLRAVLGATLADFLYTPIWWYTRGLVKQMKGVAGSLFARQEALAVDVWLKNLFVPMYGQYDWQSRIISVFMRSAQIVVRGMGVVVAALIAVVLFALYVAVPLVAIAMLIFNVTGGVFGAYGG